MASHGCWQRSSSGALEPLLAGLPAALHGLLLDGIYNGVGTVAAFVPIIVLFFLFMAMVEDSGYLSRAAFLMDALMAKLGLDGRSFVMMLMGFGCNVPALMGTRVMRSRSLRLLTMLVIPFSLCSARLQVFVFITAALFSPKAAPLVLFSLYLFSFAAAFTTALLFKNRFQNNEPFILELPPYRFPTLRQMVLRGWHEVRHFLSRASKFIIAGVVLVWLLTHFPPERRAGQYRHLGRHDRPFHGNRCSPRIGIDQHLAIALIFGFVAKEIVIGSLAVIYGLEGSGPDRHDGAATGLGAGLQLHAVHPDLHALPVHHRHDPQRIEEHPLHLVRRCLAAGAGVAVELCLLPGRQGTGLLADLADPLEKADSRRGCGIQRLGRPRHGDHDPAVGRFQQILRNPRPFVADDECRRAAQIKTEECLFGTQSRCNHLSRKIPRSGHQIAVFMNRQMKMGAHARPEHLGRPGIGTPRRQMNPSDSGSGGGSQDGTQVAGILDILKQHAAIGFPFGWLRNPDQRDDPSRRVHGRDIPKQFIAQDNQIFLRHCMEKISYFRMILCGDGNHDRFGQTACLMIGGDQMDAIQQGFAGLLALF